MKEQEFVKHRDALIAVCQRLVDHKLLRVGYRIEAEDSINSVTRIISAARIELLAGRIFEAEMLTCLLNALAHDLNDLRTGLPRIYAALSKRIRRSIGNTDFHGIRSEVAMAAVLMRQKQSIVGLERPDFQLVGGYSIECGSARISQKEVISVADISRKLRGVVEAKDKKDYASPNTALFVDVTNITFMQVRSNAFIAREAYEEAVAHANARFGSVVFTCVYADRDLKKLQCSWVRIDRADIGSELKGYLEKFYALGRPQHPGNVLAFPETS